jgi:hypothetical protein
MKLRKVDAQLIQKKGLTERQMDKGDIDMTQLRVAFLNFVDTTKNRMKIHFFWDVNMCRWASGSGGFKRSSFVHLQG